MDLHFYILWILLLMFTNCNTNTINCLNSTSCRYQTLNCTANEPCIINCDSGSEKACESTNIYQNNATNMTINCFNHQDCIDSHVYCGAGSCTLKCGNSNAEEDNQCEDSHLSCGTGPCNIHCYPNSCDDSISINITSAISFQCTGNCSASFPAPFPSTTQTPTIANESPTTASPTATVTPTTIKSTTISPTTVSPSVTSHSSTTFSTNNSISTSTNNPITTATNTSIIPSTNYSISAPTNNSITTATNTPIIPSTTNIEHVIIATDVINNIKDEKMDINNSLWYIIGAAVFALICICCVIDLKKKYNSKSNISIKDYNDVVDTMHRQSTSLQKNELNKYDGNNTKHIKTISNSIEGDIDLTNTYNVTQHHYKSSESKLNETFDSNKHDFSNHINLAVKCDEMILNDIHNHVETAGGIDIINNNNISGKTFNDNLVNVVIGNNIMMNDIINEMETKKGDFDSQDDDEYFTSGYEMGMVNGHSYKVNINK